MGGNGIEGKKPLGMISEATVLETSGQAVSKMSELIGMGCWLEWMSALSLVAVWLKDQRPASCRNSSQTLASSNAESESTF